MMRTIRSEFVKLRSTRSWWLTGLGLVALTALSLLFNILVAHYGDLAHHDPAGTGGSTAAPSPQAVQAEQDRYAQAHSASGLAGIAIRLYTSGQFLGLLLVLLVGVITMTSEYRHRTATATFLATPRRGRVVVAKFVTAALLGVAAWAVSTAVGLIGGIAYLHREGVATSLGRWDVTESILLNLAAYALWSVLGVGLGVLLRNQVGAVVTGIAGYLLGAATTGLLFEAIHAHVLQADWVIAAQVIVPASASSVMLTPGGHAFEHAPPQWVGAAVLVAYVFAAGVIGTRIARRRDVSD